ncbi:pantoate--beta-alanine ligase [Salirhabdus salicampi]|uniref:pantoate--beta-alanine ligase n=1 Tax=Salirhabdus salicampi TaxID=476102 RepID=UPI0020C588B0|nr:pantoate--beta-alanine ligase [Salirhabdus salicampi]MCP8616675.1 pantoate--beta-alanine ligase [Salirhabdus salicampi]
MKIVRTVSEMQQLSKSLQKEGKSIGLVPTMGYLHEGHQKLLREGRQQNDILILSIFLNPLQFGPTEDLDRYPKNEERDIDVAKNENVDIVFMPSVEEIYPSEMSHNISITKRTNILCGKTREGHFEGVVTVLAKLFNVTIPDNAYFGLKDAQQVSVVKAFVDDFNVPVNIVPVATVREEDGLAKSSRNVNLDTREREEAKYLYRALLHGKEFVEQGETDPKIIISAVSQFIIEHTHGKIDYVDLLSYPNLDHISEVTGDMILAVAVKFNGARLIDNVIFNKSGKLLYT